MVSLLCCFIAVQICVGFSLSGFFLLRFIRELFAVVALILLGQDRAKLVTGIHHILSERA